ncbi:MAG: hypothetical protein MI919_09745, partial [Holophagales bacterium]|nr:hypothetical protein [Holophagales bacterium]
DLLANDTFEGPASVELHSLPEKGVLRLSEGEEGSVLGFQYDPGAVLVSGWEGLTYTITAGGVESSPATVWIRLLPQRRPIAGRWPTLSCRPGLCPVNPDPGVGAEIGWYHPASGAFELCDWVGPSLVDCRVIPLPAGSEGAGHEPLVGDWDGDGWDGLGLYDPGSAMLDLFELAKSDPEMILPDLLQHAGRMSLGQPGELAVAGRWDPSAVQALFGIYPPGTGVWRLETAAGATAIRDLGDPLLRQEPLVADWWPSTAGAELALWDPASATLEVFSFSGAALSDVWTFTEPDSSDLWVVEPFAGRISGLGDGAFFGLYDAMADQIHLRSLCDGCGTLPIQVLVDP